MARGQVLLEYGLALAGLILVALVAVAVLSARTAGQVELVTATAPGAHPGDNGPIDAGALVELKETGSGQVVDFPQIVTNSDGTRSRLGDQLGSTEADPFDAMIHNVFFP